MIDHVQNASTSPPKGAAPEGGGRNPTYVVSEGVCQVFHELNATLVSGAGAGAGAGADVDFTGICLTYLNKVRPPLGGKHRIRTGTATPQLVHRRTWGCHTNAVPAMSQTPTADPNDPATPLARPTHATPAPPCTPNPR